MKPFTGSQSLHGWATVRSCFTGRCSTTRLVVVLSMLCLGTGILSAQDRANDTNPMANNPDAAASGRRLYDQTCQACHGGEARGDRGPALTGTLPHGSGDGDLFRNIRNGIAGSGMPAFSVLTADQIWQLVSY